MKIRLLYASLAAAALLLSACSSVNLWPFGEEKYQDRSKAPANSTAYQCTSGKRFYVRKLEDGAAVWLILPDREVRLNKTAESRYGNGSAVLDLSGSEASLSEGPATLSGCKASAS